MAVMEEDRRLAWRAVITCVAFVAALVLMTWLLVTFDAPQETEDLPACPLDAVQYRPPVFADEGWPTYKVMDRSTEQVTWLVRVNGEWVVL